MSNTFVNLPPSPPGTLLLDFENAAVGTEGYHSMVLITDRPRGSKAKVGMKVRREVAPEMTPWRNRVPNLPPFVAPPRTFAGGPKSANVSVNLYRTTAHATSVTAGVVFYRWGLEPVVGNQLYWEWVASETATTLGGFGVGSVLTETDSAPGKADNPGAMLYRESGVLSIWVDGTETVLAASVTPTRIGVAVSVLAADLLSLKWYADGQLVTPSAFEWALSGPLWLPVLCTLNSTVTFTMETLPS
jgi:hypothetical protein